MDAYDVFEGRQPPRRQRTDYIGNHKKLFWKLGFSANGRGILRGERYVRKMERYSQDCRLMGIDAVKFREVLREDDDEDQEVPLNYNKEYQIGEKLFMTCMWRDGGHRRLCQLGPGKSPHLQNKKW
uniref:Uncharacterized protein n=1 Tax=Ditylenchus dipsaci TaxID=166011 RepID=A0A915ESD0_9BILA